MKIKNIVDGNWPTISQSMVLHSDKVLAVDYKSNIPIRLEIASRILVLMADGWGPDDAAKKSLVYADALISEHNKTQGDE